MITAAGRFEPLVAVAFPLWFESGRALGVFAVPFLIEGEREQHLEPRNRNGGERWENEGMLTTYQVAFGN